MDCPARKPAGCQGSAERRRSRLSGNARHTPPRSGEVIARNGRSRRGIFRRGHRCGDQNTPCARRIGNRTRSALSNTSRSLPRPSSSRLTPRSRTQSSIRVLALARLQAVDHVQIEQRARRSCAQRVARRGDRATRDFRCGSGWPAVTRLNRSACGVGSAPGRAAGSARSRPTRMPISSRRVVALALQVGQLPADRRRVAGLLPSPR